jgi:hypothetical protein
MEDCGLALGLQSRNDCGEGLMGRIQLFDIADSGSDPGFFAAD